VSPSIPWSLYYGFFWTTVIGLSSFEKLYGTTGEEEETLSSARFRSSLILSRKKLRNS